MGPAPGHSPFVWSVIGGVAGATERFRLGTGVTCPLIRIHPALVAQAACSGAAAPGRTAAGTTPSTHARIYTLPDPNAAELAGRAEVVPHGPDPEPMLKEIRSFAEAGFTHVYVHQIGPDQEGFLDFARRELLPHV